MAGIFLKIVNMSISSCWIVLAIILLRVILKKAPKWINCVLWGIAGLRLVMPFSFESIFSLIPSTETITKLPDSPRPHIESGVPIIDNPVNDYLQGNYFEGVTRPTGNFIDVTAILAIIWVIGIVALLIYTLVSFLRLNRKIGTAVLLRDNIYQSEAVISPFVLGIIKPKIYLPFNMKEQDMDHVIAHEQAHIRRKDHLWKPLGFLILTFHWFNPLIWLGYILLCRDIELACDEKVVKKLNIEQRADYSEALLNSSVNKRMIAACPLAFGETGVKDRVKSVLNYKKPAFWIILIAVIVSITTAVCFLTDPLDKTEIRNGSYRLSDELYFNGSYSLVPDTERNRIEIKTKGGMHIYHFIGEELSTGALYKEVKLNMESLLTLFGDMPELADSESIQTLLKNNKEAWYDKTPDDINRYPYMLLLQNDGTLYIVFADLEKGEATNLRYIYKLEYTENGLNSVDDVSLEKLREKYPQFFNVSTDGGLTVYVWQTAEDDYRCYLANTFTEAIADNSFAYETGASIAEMRTILTTYDVKKEDIVIQPVKNPLCSYSYNINNEYKEITKRLFWSAIPEAEDSTNFENNTLPHGSFENPYHIGDTIELCHGDSLHKEKVYNYSITLKQVLKDKEAEEKLKEISSNFDEEKFMLEERDLYLALVHIKFKEESTIKDHLPSNIGMIAINSEGHLFIIDSRFFIPSNDILTENGETVNWYPVLAPKGENVCLTFTVGTPQEAPGIISGVSFAVPSSENLEVTPEATTDITIPGNDNFSETDVLKTRWIYRPMLSYTGHSFYPFIFDTDYTHIIASCDNGYIKNLDFDGQPKGKSLEFTKGQHIYWTPEEAVIEKIPQKAEVTFKVYNGETEVHRGSAVFECTSSDTFSAEFNISLKVSEGLTAVYDDGIKIVRKLSISDIVSADAPLNMSATIDGYPFFIAKILEIHNNSLLVKAVSDIESINADTEYLISTDIQNNKIPAPDFEVGTKITVVYNGEISETAPAQIDYVYAIFNTEEDLPSSVSPTVSYPSEKLVTAISEVLKNAYRTESPDGLIHIENYYIISNLITSGTPLEGNSGHIKKSTVYLLVYHAEYSVNGQTLTEAESGFVPTVISFGVDENNEHTPEEYWTPEPDKNSEKEVRDKFPEKAAEEALRPEKIAERLKKENQKMAYEYLNSIISAE